MNVVLAFPSAFASGNVLVKAIRVAGGRLAITFEQGFLVCETGRPVELASRLEHVFGIDQVAIAKKVKSEFKELSSAIVEVGSKVILPGEKFFVKVKADGTDYAGRDIEFASSGMLTAKLAETGARPAKNEQESDRLVVAFVGSKSAYVCVQVRNGPGGLPFGSLGKALCSSHSPISLLSCTLAAKAGFVPEIVLLYSDEDELRANAKLAEILVTKIGLKEHTIKIAPIDISGTDAMAELAKEAIAAEILIRQQGDRVILPFTPTIHPLWFIEAIAAKAIAAGKAPYMPLMFVDVPGSTKMQVAKKEFQKYRNTIDAATESSIKKMKRMKLKVGPNYLNDILDSI